MTDLPLHVISETKTMIRVGWTPVPGAAGYVYRVDGRRVSNTWDPAKSWTDFSKALGTKYGVEAIAPVAAGIYPPPVTPTPPPPAPNVVEIAGKLTAAQWLEATHGKTLARPKQGSVVTVAYTAADLVTADGNLVVAQSGLVCEDIWFDGQGQVPRMWFADVINFGFRRGGFRRFWTPATADHCEACYVGGGTENGFWDGVRFDDNGNTAHLFFTWFGSSKRGGAYDHANYPRTMRVRGCTFGDTHGAFFAINFAQSNTGVLEIPLTADLCIQQGQPSVKPLSINNWFVKAACP